MQDQHRLLSLIHIWEGALGIEKKQETYHASAVTQILEKDFTFSDTFPISPGKEAAELCIRDSHEAGHAVQYAEGYGPVRLRTAIIPATQFGSKFSFILLFLGLILYNQAFFGIGIVLFSLTTIFQLVTLPVEFNASHRAMETIEGMGLLDEDEQQGARKVMRAAALPSVCLLYTSRCV